MKQIKIYILFSITKNLNYLYNLFYFINYIYIKYKVERKQLILMLYCKIIIEFSFHQWFVCGVIYFFDKIK